MKTVEDVKRWVRKRTCLYYIFWFVAGSIILAIFIDKCVVYSYSVYRPLLSYLWHNLGLHKVLAIVQWFGDKDFWLCVITLMLDAVGLTSACRYLYRYWFWVENLCASSCGEIHVTQMFSDAPIKSSVNDLYSRGAYVAMLSNVIMSKCSEVSATYVGIYGSWGDGKTSVRNLTEEYIRNLYGDGRALFIDFSPWEYPESCDLRMELFEKVASVLSKAKITDGSFTFSQLARFFSLRRSNRRMGFLQDVIDLFRGLWFAHVVKEDDLVEAVKTSLRNMSQRLVIVVDDLERLTKDDVGKVVRFLKANGDLPNIVYLILTDEDYLASAVSEMVGRPAGSNIDVGREYLQKIVTLRCPLPEINGDKLRKNFTEGVQDLLKAYDIHSENFEDACEWASHYLQNPRKVKLLLNSFSVTLARYKRLVNDAQYLGVHVGDLLALTALQFAEPKVYKHLCEGYSGLLEKTSIYLGSDKGASDEWMEKAFYRYLSDTSHELLDVFLKERLGIVIDNGSIYDKKPKTYKLNNPDDPELMLNCRLASRFCFMNYFISENDGLMPQQDFEDFKAAIMANRFPETLIERINGEDKLPMLLYALNGVNVFPTRQSSDNYIRSLVKMANMGLKSIDTDSDCTDFHSIIRTGIYSRVYFCLHRYCKKLQNKITNGDDIFGKDVEYVGEFLLPILREEKDVVLTAHLIATDAKYHNGESAENHYGAIFSHEDYEQLREGYLVFIEAFQEQDRLMSHEEFFDLFRCWRNLLKEYKDDKFYASFRKACMPAIYNLSALSKILVFFSDDNQASDDEEDFIVTVRLDDLEQFFGTNGINQIIRVLEESPNISERNFKMLTVLKWAISEKHKGNLYDVDAQKQYLQCEMMTKTFKDRMLARTGVVHKTRRKK
jgi:hypothetical protein